MESQYVVQATIRHAETDSLRIPDANKESVQVLLSLGESRLTALVEAVKSARLARTTEQFSEGVASSFPEEQRATVSDIVSLLLTLEAVRSANDISPEEFVEDLLVAADAASLTPTDYDRESILAYLLQIFACERTIGAVVKARNLVLENPAIFLHARILTDIRPVFLRDSKEPPVLGVIQHTLRLTYASDSGQREFYVSMDSLDLTKLGEVVSRAIEKDTTGTELLRSATLQRFEPSGD
jgi:hypothetical protein